MARAKREVVLDVHADCDQVLRALASREPGFYFEGMGRLIEKGEKKEAHVLTFASPKKGKLRVEVRMNRSGDSLVYELRGDAKGKLVVTALPRGPRCRVYIEAEAEGKLIEQYGGEALSRAVNRFATTIISMFPATLQPRIPGGRLGDIFVELLKLLSLAHAGPGQIRAASIKTMALNLEENKVVAVDGVSDKDAEKLAKLFIDGVRALNELSNSLGTGSVQRLAMVSDSAIIYANIGGGLAVLTVIEKSGEEGE